MNKAKWLCPECGSDNIYYNIGANSSLMGLEGTNELLITQGLVPAIAALDVYVCGDCGAVRTFVSEQEALRLIAEKWSRLNE